MCGRYMLTTPVDALRQLFLFTERPNLQPRYNIAPTQDVPIVRRTRDGAARELILVRWGLVPYWAKDPKIGNRLINARAESVARAPAFREAWRRRRRLLPADGFFEWQKAGKVRQPLLVRRKDQAPFAFERNGGCFVRHDVSFKKRAATFRSRARVPRPTPPRRRASTATMPLARSPVPRAVRPQKPR